MKYNIESLLKIVKSQVKSCTEPVYNRKKPESKSRIAVPLKLLKELLKNHAEVATFPANAPRTCGMILADKRHHPTGETRARRASPIQAG